MPDLFFLLQKSLREYYNFSSLPSLEIAGHERHGSHLSQPHFHHILLYTGTVSQTAMLFFPNQKLFDRCWGKNKVLERPSLNNRFTIVLS